MRPLFLISVLIAPALFLNGCKFGGNASSISLSETARRATPTINALLEAGKKNDVIAALQTFTPASQNESDLNLETGCVRCVHARFGRRFLVLEHWWWQLF